VLPVLLRAAPWRSVLGLSVAAGAVGAAAVAAGATGMGLKLLQITTVLVGGAGACALDDPAAAVVRSCPVRWSRQVLVRAQTGLVPLLVGLVAVVSWWQRAQVDRVLLLQLGGCWLLGFALATVARVQLDEPAEVVASGLVLGLLTLLLFERVGRHLALFPTGEDAHRTVVTWWVVIGCCVGALLLVVREKHWKH
jgi:hypothetical protein